MEEVESIVDRVAAEIREPFTACMQDRGKIWIDMRN